LSDDDVLSQAFPAPDGIVRVSLAKIQKACKDSKFAQAWSRLLGTKGGDKGKAANSIRDIIRRKVRQNSQSVPLAVTKVSARQTAQLVEPPQPILSAESNLTYLPTNHRMIIRAIFSGGPITQALVQQYAQENREGFRKVFEEMMEERGGN
jgi:hypothetical protein